MEKLNQYLQTIQEWIYRSILAKKHKQWLKEGYDRGYEHAEADIAYFKRTCDDEIKKIQAICDGKIAQADYDKEKFIADLLEKWFVDPAKVFTVTKSGIIMLNGEQITQQEMINLKSEVRSFRSMVLYEIIMNTLRQKSVEKSILASNASNYIETNPELLAGKMMIFNLDIIKNIISKIDNFKMK